MNSVIFEQLLCYMYSCDWKPSLVKIGKVVVLFGHQRPECDHISINCYDVGYTLVTISPSIQCNCNNFGSQNFYEFNLG